MDMNNDFTPTTLITPDCGYFWGDNNILHLFGEAGDIILSEYHYEVREVMTWNALMQLTTVYLVAKESSTNGMWFSSMEAAMRECEEDATHFIKWAVENLEKYPVNDD